MFKHLANVLKNQHKCMRIGQTLANQRRNARAETAPVLVDEEEEEAPVVSEQHEVAYHLVQYSTVQYSTR